MTRRVSSPELVDRSGELDALTTAWQVAQCGRPRVVLVRADAGLRKTRLLRAFETDGLAGHLVLHGSCVHANGFASPLQPLAVAR